MNRKTLIQALPKPSLKPIFSIPFSFLIFILVLSKAPAAQDPVVLPEAFAEKATGDLQLIRKRGVVRALVTPSKTEFFLDRATPRGLQTELLEQYKKFLNKGIKKKGHVDIVYIPVTFDRLLPALIEGEGDIAAALLTITPERKEKVNFATGEGLKVNELVVTAKNVVGLNSVEDLQAVRFMCFGVAAMQNTCAN